MSVEGAVYTISELLAPNFIDQKSAMEKQFQGVTAEEFSYEEYELVKTKLVNTAEFSTLEHA